MGVRPTKWRIPELIAAGEAAGEAFIERHGDELVGAGARATEPARLPRTSTRRQPLHRDPLTDPVGLAGLPRLTDRPADPDGYGRTMASHPFEQQITFVFVTDLARSAAFYGDALGLELARDQGACQIYRVADDAYLGLCDHRPCEPGGLILTLVSDDVDGWANRLRAAGYEIDGPADNDRYAIRHVFVRDPDGHLVEIQRFDDPLI